MNQVVIVGRLGQDPEIRYFESGTVKAKFSVAVDRNFSKTNPVTDWFNIEVWGRQAEFVGEWVKKGQLVSVVGILEMNRWTDNTGNERETPIVRAIDIRLEGSKRDNAQAGGGGSQYGNAGNTGNSGYGGGYGNAPEPVVPF
ncbi:MAG: single-stranded DNA-binding protein [Candidatus Melainabacteria bacterium]|nr:single-stranded DNA-binding protein [Candidatus Melainabacteria bacterium]